MELPVSNCHKFTLSFFNRSLVVAGLIDVRANLFGDGSIALLFPVNLLTDYAGRRNVFGIVSLSTDSRPQRVPCSSSVVPLQCQSAAGAPIWTNVLLARPNIIWATTR